MVSYILELLHNGILYTCSAFGMIYNIRDYATMVGQHPTVNKATKDTAIASSLRWQVCATMVMF